MARISGLLLPLFEMRSWKREALEVYLVEISAFFLAVNWNVLFAHFWNSFIAHSIPRCFTENSRRLLPQSFFPTSGLILCFAGIYGVGKAALHPPALAVLSHTPDGATQTIAWVGKGIVYDTGGLSIKGKVRYHLFCCCLCWHCCFLMEIIQFMSIGKQSIFILIYCYPCGHKLPGGKTKQDSRSILWSS